ncbi:MAG: hypothetical protein EP343_25325 [Deltaproteobacteria bacterium]|nr:MAG: hypothetical protein EP343_25325 [Deltaproteobacteria bacterium]
MSEQSTSSLFIVKHKARGSSLFFNNNQNEHRNIGLFRWITCASLAIGAFTFQTYYGFAQPPTLPSGKTSPSSLCPSHQLFVRPPLEEAAPTGNPIQIRRIKGKLVWQRGSLLHPSQHAARLHMHLNTLKRVQASGKKTASSLTPVLFEVSCYYFRKAHYHKAIQFASRILAKHPQHLFHQKSMNLIFHVYDRLRQWRTLEQRTKAHLKHKSWVHKPGVKKELYLAMARSGFLRIMFPQNTQLPPLQKATQLEAYEAKYGKKGPWVKQGFQPSPASATALALAGIYYVEGKRIDRAIRVQKRLLQRYPNPAGYHIASLYDQFANKLKKALTLRPRLPTLFYQAIEKRAQPNIYERNAPQPIKNEQILSVLREKSTSLYSEVVQVATKLGTYNRWVGLAIRRHRKLHPKVVRFPHTLLLPIPKENILWNTFDPWEVTRYVQSYSTSIIYY